MSDDIYKPQLELCLQLSNSFYYGPEDDFTELQWEHSREPLYKPKIEFVADLGEQAIVSLAEAEKSFAELVKYYEDVLAKHKKHNKPVWGDNNSPSPYFSLTGFIYAKAENGDDGFDLNFPWYDTVNEYEAVLKALTSKEEGQVLNDIEQGWAIDLSNEDDVTHFIETDDTATEIYAEGVYDRAHVAKQAEALKAPLENIHKKLVAHFGEDYWNYRG